MAGSLGLAQSLNSIPRHIGAWTRHMEMEHQLTYQCVGGGEAVVEFVESGETFKDGVEGRAFTKWWEEQVRMVLKSLPPGETPRVTAKGFMILDGSTRPLPTRYLQYIHGSGQEKGATTTDLLAIPFGSRILRIRLTAAGTRSGWVSEKHRFMLEELAKHLEGPSWPSLRGTQRKAYAPALLREVDSLHRLSLRETSLDRKRALRSEAMHRAPESPWADAARAFLVLTRDNVMAEYYLTKAMAGGLRDWSMLHNRGIALSGQQRYPEAIRDFTEALRLDSSRHMTWSERGSAWYLLRDFACSRLDLREAILREPFRWEYFLLLAKADEEDGDLEAAAHDYHFARAMAPTDRQEDLSETLISVLTRSGRFDTAAAQATNAISRYPRNPRFPALRAACRWLLGDQSGAELDFERSLLIAPNQEAVYRSRGELRFRAGQFAGAEEDLDILLKRHPRDTELLALRGRIRLARGKPTEALQDFSAAVSIDSTNIGAEYYRALIFVQSERYEEAREPIRRLLPHPLLRAKALVLRGMIAMEENRLEDALRDLTESIALEPGNAAVWLNRSRVYNFLNLPEEAARDKEQARKLGGH